MAGVLTDFVLRLTLDPDAAERFRQSPDFARDVIAAAGLSDEHAALLQSGDARRLYDALAAEAPSATVGRVLEHPSEPAPPAPMPPDSPSPTPEPIPPAEPIEMGPGLAYRADFARP